MATKKEKHAATMARRELFLAENRRIGLEAQRKDHEHKTREAAKKEREAVARNKEVEGIFDV